MSDWIAYDSNNVLGVIECCAGLDVSRLKADGPFSNRNIEGICAAVAKDAHFTCQLIIFSRKQILLKKPCSVNAIIKDLPETVRRITGADTKARLDLQPSLLGMMADPTLRSSCL